MFFYYVFKTIDPQAPHSLLKIKRQLLCQILFLFFASAGIFLLVPFMSRIFANARIPLLSWSVNDAFLMLLLGLFLFIGYMMMACGIWRCSWFAELFKKPSLSSLTELAEYIKNDKNGYAATYVKNIHHRELTSFECILLNHKEEKVAGIAGCIKKKAKDEARFQKLTAQIARNTN